MQDTSIKCIPNASCSNSEFFEVQYLKKKKKILNPEHKVTLENIWMHVIDSGSNPTRTKI